MKADQFLKQKPGQGVCLDVSHQSTSFVYTYSVTVLHLQCKGRFSHTYVFAHCNS